MKRYVKSLFVGGGTIISLMVLVSLVFSGLANAVSYNPGPRISFTFDDGLASAYTLAAPTLAKYGLTGTDYVITGCVGMTTVPNTCLANTGTPYMTWAQIVALQNTYSWDVGSHTVDHKCLASNATADPEDCQTATLTQAQVITELSASQTALAAQGIKATDFSTPYGDYNNMVLAQIAKYYASMRGFQDQNINGYPYSDYLLNDYVVLEKTTPVATVEARIDQAIANNQWLVLTFHDIAATPSQTPDNYQYGTAELDQIAAYVQAKQTAGLIKNININQGLITSSTNLFANGSFNNGIADGWTTDDPTNITANNGTNGSYPDPVNSVKLVSNTAGTATHLFSPKVAVNPNNTYVLKNFLNVQAITSGEVSFYIDEYNASGTWISGQYKTREVSAFVEELNFNYTPSSVAVTQASLQVIVAGQGITAYLDNAQMFPDAAAVSTLPATIAGDLNGDSIVNAADLSLLLTNWNKTGATAAQGDLNSDGAVNAADLSTLLTNWSK
ncbi:MAG TPA: polysaccharide deacetylase family protein [Patescibacteria group bacterium]|nr:polysaccharide deacetylase family protein [Patescibacteria group bacterium]